MSDSKAHLGATTGNRRDLCLESVRLRLEDREVDGIRSAMAIAKLLGQDEVVALMEDKQEPSVIETVPLAAKALTPVINGDEVAQVLRLRRHTRQ